MSNRKALVVGINDYPGTVNDLPSCVDDGKGFAGLLGNEAYGFQEIRTLFDGQATIQAVTAGLEWLCGQGPPGGASQNTPDDRLVLFFSGHGYRTERNGVLRECLVLRDGFFFDDELVKQTQGVPPGILTIVLDSCHSGGMDKRFFEMLGAPGSGVKDLVERVRVKTWLPEPEELAKSFTAEASSIPFKPFGRAVFQRPPGLSAQGKAFVGPAAIVAQTKDAAEPQVNGLMITACQADQTASASSSQTQGKSAFTFCLLNTINKLGDAPPGPEGLTARKLFDAVAQELITYQFQQTPSLIEPPNDPDLETRTFLTLQPIPGSVDGPAQPAAGSLQAPAGASQAMAQGVVTSTPGKGFLVPDTTRKATNQGDRPMNNQQISVSSASRPANLPSAKQSAGPPNANQPAGSLTASQLASSLAASQPAGSQGANQSTGSPTASQAVSSQDANQPTGSPTASQAAGPLANVHDEAQQTVLLAILSGLVKEHVKELQSTAAGTADGQDKAIEEKSWDWVLPAVKTAIKLAPTVWGAVDSYRKKKEFEDQKAFQAGDPVAPASQPPVVNEKLLNILPQILPSILQTMQSKDLQPNDGDAASLVMDEKTMSILPQILPSIVQTMQSKGFHVNWNAVGHVAAQVAPIALAFL